MQKCLFVVHTNDNHPVGELQAAEAAGAVELDRAGLPPGAPAEDRVIPPVVLAIVMPGPAVKATCGGLPDDSMRSWPLASGPPPRKPPLPPLSWIAFKEPDGAAPSMQSASALTSAIT